MVPRGRGTILFTGATASVRGSAGFAAFAGAKHALRALAQSMARELGPQGIHVAHVVIDGAIDTPWIHENFPGAWRSSQPDGLLEPEAIAENYWHLHRNQAPRGRSSSICAPTSSASDENNRVSFRLWQPH